MSLSGCVFPLFFMSLLRCHNALNEKSVFRNGTEEVLHSSKSLQTQRCSAAQYRYGQWIPGADKCGIKGVYDHPLIERCTSPDNKQILHHYSDWCWSPIGCISESFSVQAFCRRLNGRGILLVGDSIQHQFYDALFMQLGTKGQPLDQWTLEANIISKESGAICVGQGGGRLIYLRNDQIAVTGNTPLYESDPHYKSDWTSIAPMFEIIVLNKGAHYIGNEVLFLNETHDTAHWLRKNIDFNKTHIFFRDTPQGHPLAQPDTTAVTDSIISAPNWIKNDQYGWSNFPQRNHLAIKIFESILGPYLTVLYVAHMTLNRPDGHRGQTCTVTDDNLHYFLPSVVDSWVQVLFNLMPEG